jgi:hypothetical protein
MPQILRMSLKGNWHKQLKLKIPANKSPGKVEMYQPTGLKRYRAPRQCIKEQCTPPGSGHQVHRNRNHAHQNNNGDQQYDHPGW